MFTEPKARLHIKQLAVAAHLESLSYADIAELAATFDWSLKKTNRFVQSLKTELNNREQVSRIRKAAVGALTQAHCAEQTGLSQPTISRWINGYDTDPRCTPAMAELLGINENELGG